MDARANFWRRSTNKTWMVAKMGRRIFTRRYLRHSKLWYGVFKKRNSRLQCNYYLGHILSWRRRQTEHNFVRCNKRSFWISRITSWSTRAIQILESWHGYRWAKSIWNSINARTKTNGHSSDDIYSKSW